MKEKNDTIEAAATALSEGYEVGTQLLKLVVASVDQIKPGASERAKLLGLVALRQMLLAGQDQAFAGHPMLKIAEDAFFSLAKERIGEAIAKNKIEDMINEKFEQ